MHRILLTQSGHSRSSTFGRRSCLLHGRLHNHCDCITATASNHAHLNTVDSSVLVCLRHQVANTAWAFAKFNHLGQKLFEALARAAPPRMKEFNVHHIANTAWHSRGAATQSGSCSRRWRGHHRCRRMSQPTESRQHSLGIREVQHSHTEGVCCLGDCTASTDDGGQCTADANPAWAFATPSR